MADILFQTFNGLSDSLWRGLKDSFYRCVGLDIHSNPGSITVNQKLSLDSGATVTAFCRVALSTSDGGQIWFSYTDGKIWYRSTAGAWTLVYTTAPGAGSAGCLGAEEYNAYIYWGTQSRLHRMPVANIATAAGWTANAVPNWQTFTSTDAEWHPMVIQISTLFIGDGYQVAKVDSAAAFTASAISFLAPIRIKDMTTYGTDLVIGTFIKTTANYAWLFRWDGVQTNQQYSELVEENGINCFMYQGNTLLVQCGTAGNWYFYDGTQLQFYKKIPGTWTPTKFGEVYPNSAANYRGVPVFAFSNSPLATNSTGNPVDQGIYTMGQYSKDYPVVINGPEYIISQDKVATIECGALLVEGNDVYLAWKDGSNYGVDKVDAATKYASAYLETVRITPYIKNNTTTYRVFVNYQSLPASTSVTFKYKSNGDAAYTAMTTIDDTLNQRLYAELSVDGRAFQIRVEFTTATNNAPVVEHLGIELAN